MDSLGSKLFIDCSIDMYKFLGFVVEQCDKTVRRKQQDAQCSQSAFVFRFCHVAFVFYSKTVNTPKTSKVQSFLYLSYLFTLGPI